MEATAVVRVTISMTATHNLNSLPTTTRNKAINKPLLQVELILQLTHTLNTVGIKTTLPCGMPPWPNKDKDKHLVNSRILLEPRRLLILVVISSLSIVVIPLIAYFDSCCSPTALDACVCMTMMLFHAALLTTLD